MSSSIDRVCPLKDIGTLVYQRKRIDSSAAIVQVISTSHTTHFLWQRESDAAAQGQLNGPFGSKAAALAECADVDGVGAAELLFDTEALHSAKRQREFAAVPISEVAEFWDARPCNLRHSAAAIGSKAYFDDVERRKYRVEPHIRAFADFARWQDCDVLEIGCGLGTESVNFARAGARLVAVDLSARSVALTRQRLQVMGVTATVLQANAETLLEDLARHFGARDKIPQFDLVWSFGVLHHTPSPRAAVAQIEQLIRPGGELRVMVYAKVSYKLFFLMRETGMWDFARINQLIGEFSEAQSGCPVTYSYTVDEVQTQLLSPQQWSVLDVHKDHIFAFSIPEYRKFEYVREACWAGVTDEQFAQLEKELGWHLLVTAKKK